MNLTYKNVDWQDKDERGWWFRTECATCGDLLYIATKSHSLRGARRLLREAKWKPLDVLPTRDKPYMRAICDKCRGLRIGV